MKHFEALKLGRLLREIRRVRGLTQREVSDRLAMNQGNYSRLEKGEQRVSYDRITAIAEMLHIPVLQLIAVLEYLGDESRNHEPKQRIPIYDDGLSFPELKEILRHFNEMNKGNM